MNEIDVDIEFIFLHIQGYMKLDLNFACYSFLFYMINLLNILVEVINL